MVGGGNNDQTPEEGTGGSAIHAPWPMGQLQHHQPSRVLPPSSSSLRGRARNGGVAGCSAVLDLTRCLAARHQRGRPAGGECRAESDGWSREHGGARDG
jgi:hypothetical protein